MKCAVYLRKSVHKDKEAGCLSVEAQERKIREWAERSGHSILEEWVVSDVDLSGATPNRPGFQRLYQAARTQQVPFNAIVVTDFDRFFRGLVKQHRYIDEFQSDFGVNVVSLKHITKSRLECNVDGVISEEERERARERTIQAMDDIAAHQEYSCGGTSPLGYVAACGWCDKILPCGCVKRSDPRARRLTKLQIDPASACIVGRIFEAYGAGQSLGDIARTLNAEGVRTPGAGTLRNGRGWAMTSVRAILLNETYIGKRIYKKTQKVSRSPTRQVRRAPEEWITRECPELAIIDRELWRRVHEIRGGRAVRARACFRPGEATRLYRQHLLSGMLICDACGGRLTIEASTSSTKRTYRYYLCRRAKEGACSNRRSYRLDRAEAWIEKVILDAVTHPQHVRDYAAAIERKHLERRKCGSTKQRRDDIGRELGAVEAKLENILRFVAGARESDFGRFRQEARILEDLRHELEGELAGLDRVVPLARAPKHEIEAEVARVREAIDHLTPEKRRRLFDVLQCLIRVYADGRAVLEAEPGGLLDPILEAASTGQRAAYEGLWVIGAGSGI